MSQQVLTDKVAHAYAAPERHRPRDRHAWWSHAMISPAVLFVAVMLYLPFLWSVFISFTHYGGSGTPQWAGLANYRHLIDDPVLATTVRNTALWVVGTLVLPVGLALLIAVLTYNVRGGIWLRLPFLLPYAISGTATALAWGFVLQDKGALNSLLATLHLPGAHTSFLQTAPLNTIVMILAQTWQSIGVNLLLFVVGLQSIPRETIEAARVDGASGWKLFSRIVWPMMRPLTAVVVGLALVAGLKTFDVVWIMTQGGPGRSSETLSITMYRDAFVSGDYGYGAGVAVLLTVVGMLVSLLYLRQQAGSKRQFDITGGGR
ncbi:carbohydrate ABC transporter permease [Streptomyces sp. NPDC049040]|uniref:carbohydrate ABC transporter permease n=1 Tax=Streptomyces sp. NPDC049040 TaxID=3365593 RepID=UPI0037201C4A